ncbi:MAG: S41 family peptidase [Roseiflexaceae bacterium]|jgi:carboxyl-terminal processing protease|nr:S41 family peptidase [Chloroflexaceae bacterium]
MIREILRLRLPIWFVVPLVALMSIVTLGLGYVLATQFTTPCTLTRDECVKLERLYNAWEIVSDNYVDPDAAGADAMIDGAISGLVDSVGDRGHSRYISPQDAAAEREALQGSYEGIGAYLSERDGYVIIASPIEGSPAAAAGILPGDRVLSVDGEDMRDASISELQRKVRGPSGTSVTLLIQHETGERVTVTITRASIEIPSVTWKMLPNDVAHIHLNQFSAQATDDMQAALRSVREANAKAIILDLRNNPGGYVDQLMNVASEFLPTDTTVLIEETRDGTRTPYTTSGSGMARDIPMVVLINNNSASAAEILAGAIKSSKRAPIVGEATYGTATVLRSFSLDSGAEIRLGTSQWLTPEGQEVRGVGIAPTQEVVLSNLSDMLNPTAAAKLSASELLASSDTQLAAALQLLGYK